MLLDISVNLYSSGQLLSSYKLFLRKEGWFPNFQVGDIVAVQILPSILARILKIQKEEGTRLSLLGTRETFKHAICS